MADHTSVPDRRDEIIDSACSIIAEKGFEGLRIREVAERVEINSATLYYYFATKGKLIDSVVTTIVDHIRQSTSSGNNDTSPIERLKNHILGHFRYAREYPQRMKALGEIVLRATRHDQHKKVIDNLNAEWFTLLSTIITDGIQEGDFSANLNIEATVNLLVIILQGIVFVQPDDAPMDEQIFAQIETWLCD